MVNVHHYMHEAGEALVERDLVGHVRSTNPALYRALQELFEGRREARRLQAEQAVGELAVVLRGRCAELTTILNEVFPHTTMVGASK